MHRARVFVFYVYSLLLEGVGEEIIGWMCRDELLWYDTLCLGYFCNLVISITIINILLCNSISNIVKV